MVLPEKKAFSYKDYMTLSEDVIYEVLNGEVINMSPSPTPKHQDVADELTAELKMFFRGKECIAFSAPMDVCLVADNDTKHEDILDWVQPDVFAVCDRGKIGEKSIIGAPDLIIEVLSPSTARNDRLIKFKSYEKARVKEYWIADPSNMYVEVYILQDDSFKQFGIYGKDDSLSARIFPDLEIDLQHVFKE